jgi:hypothetical protein
MASPNFEHPTEMLQQAVAESQAASLTNLQQEATAAQERLDTEQSKIAHHNAQTREFIRDTAAAANLNRTVRDLRLAAEAEKNAIDLIAAHPEFRDLSDIDGSSYRRMEQIPLDVQRSLVKARQDLDRATLSSELLEQQRIAQPQAQPQPAGPLVHYVDNQNGTVTAKLQTGETFTGTPQQVIVKIGESKINTRRWAEEKVAAAQGQKPTNPQQPANGQQLDPGLDANQPFDSQAYLREETAKAFGFNNAEEMISDYGFMREQAEKYRILELSSSFHSRNQDFPNTDKAVEALEAVCRANNWDMENIDNLSNAHAVAVRHGLYQPLTQEQIRASVAGPEPLHRPSPPPIPRGGNPENNRPTMNEWEMPLDQLRKQALSAQTGGR